MVNKQTPRTTNKRKPRSYYVLADVLLLHQRKYCVEVPATVKDEEMTDYLQKNISAFRHLSESKVELLKDGDSSIHVRDWREADFPGVGYDSKDVTANVVLEIVWRLMHG